MAEIVSAAKTEIMTSVEIKEYERQLVVSRSTSGEVTIAFKFPDPARAERTRIRALIAATLEDPGKTVESLLADFDAQDAKRVSTWGADKGTPLPMEQSLYVTREQARVLTNLMTGEPVAYEVRETIEGAISKKSW